MNGGVVTFVSDAQNLKGQHIRYWCWTDDTPVSKHFSIEDTECLVECRHFSTAWKVGEDMDVVPQYQGASWLS